ncbi:MAG: hypothetical protein H7Y00_08460 [Fimbriimonadaceae bacterium]|nr:hypothetical protein [Chitinophagales bacterium]
MEKKLIEEEDYYINADGYFVFTEKYLKERGYCCRNGCLHCPYKREDLLRQEEQIKKHP